MLPEIHELLLNQEETNIRVILSPYKLHCLHTISNKLVSKVSAQKEGEKSYDSSNMCSIFCGFRSSPPLTSYARRVALNLTGYARRVAGGGGGGGAYLNCLSFQM